MTAPVTLPSPDRLNMGGAYAVTISGREHRSLSHRDYAAVVAEQLTLSQRGVLKLTWDNVGKWLKLGTVTPDGSLSVEPELWAKRHYRRAIMRGAGVYRWGLWAAFGARRAEADAQAGAALVCEPMNGVAQLDGFTPWGAAPLPLPPGAVFYAPRYSRPARPLTLPRVTSEVLREGLALLERVIPSRKSFTDLLRLAFWPPFEAEDAREFDLLTVGVPFEAKLLLKRTASLAAHLPLLERVLFLEAIRAALRVLRRMLPRVRRPRQTRPAPRPLYARPRPPAAPLAPPALA